MLPPGLSSCARPKDEAAAPGHNLRAYAKQIAPHLAWLADEIAFVDEKPAPQAAASATVLDAVRQWSVDAGGNATKTEWTPGPGDAELLIVSRWYDAPEWVIDVEREGTTARVRFHRPWVG